MRNSENMPLDELARILRAVADPARLRLLRLCFDQPTSVSELAAAVADSEPNVSRHLKQLATVGLLRRARRGQRVEYLPMIGGGFAAELALQLLTRIDPADPGLQQARARLRALESESEPHEALLGSSRLGRALAAALESALGRDVAGLRILARAGNREVLEVLARWPAKVTLRVDAAAERGALQAWADANGARFEFLSRRQAREAQPFDVCIESPGRAELQSAVQVPAWLEKTRRSVAAHGVLWCAVPYDALEDGGAAPPLRLRALLDEQGLDCLTLVPVEAEGHHLLVARSRARIAPGAHAADMSISLRRPAFGP
jgi:DNA-binding transcriptional ArsR family regulator